MQMTAAIPEKLSWLTLLNQLCVSSAKYTDQCPQHTECSRLVNDSQLCTSVPARGKSQERVSNKFMPVVLIIVIM